MSNESKQTKPDCPLIGQDGNIFNLVGIAAKTSKRNGLSSQLRISADRFLSKKTLDINAMMCYNKNAK